MGGSVPRRREDEGTVLVRASRPATGRGDEPWPVVVRGDGIDPWRAVLAGRSRVGRASQSGGDLDAPVYSAPPWSDVHIAPGERAGEPEAPNPNGVTQGL